MKKILSTVFVLWFTAALFWFPAPARSENLQADKFRNIQKLIGNKDAILVADYQGKVLFSKNADKRLVPASTLKILTSLVALHHLGRDFRFITEFYTDEDSNLKVKGYGDPLLISEMLDEISETLGAKIEKYNNLILDNSYFEYPITVPGVTSSFKAYDATNGALCVNFNTVFFKRIKKGKYVSAEPQTPLVPFALKRIRKSGIRKGRITFSPENNETALYTGHLFKYFLEKQGIKSQGKIKMGKVQEKDSIIFKYESDFSLEHVVSKLLDHSNNFIANQVLLAAGAKAYGPPGTLEKGVQAAYAYIKSIPGAENISITEGSGISRKNRISANNMLRLLEKFEPFHTLMRHDGREFYKTGTLSGISTRAGYIEGGKGRLYRFVVLMNTSGRSAKNITKKLIKVCTK
ncbi:MAG: D-alanyl-D-alanine carboxypeptidase [Desulfobacteraceae bacterium]|nr:D-alanyl-D-alanine carboxypeptidase [Desulfobacteraceae bacterium]